MSCNSENVAELSTNLFLPLRVVGVLYLCLSTVE